MVWIDRAIKICLEFCSDKDLFLDVKSKHTELTTVLIAIDFNYCLVWLQSDFVKNFAKVTIFAQFLNDILIRNAFVTRFDK